MIDPPVVGMAIIRVAKESAVVYDSAHSFQTRSKPNTHERKIISDGVVMLLLWVTATSGSSRNW